MDNQKNKKCIGDYVISLDEKLGEGAYGTVYKARLINDESKIFACKIIIIDDNQTQDSELIKREKDITYDINNKSGTSNVVRLEEYYVSTRNLYLFSEFCQQGDLRKRIIQKKTIKNSNTLPSGFTEKEVLHIIADIIHGYQTLHKYNIIHRDLKPENILISGDTFKIGDFGLARYCPTDANLILTSNRCTQLYASPQSFSNNYTNLCDIWSLGIIFYELIYGNYPFVQKIKTLGEVSYQPSLNKDQLQRPHIEGYQNCSDQIWKILVKMLAYEESNRMTWEECFQKVELQQKELKQNKKNLYNLIKVLQKNK